MLRYFTPELAKFLERVDDASRRSSTSYYRHHAPLSRALCPAMIRRRSGLGDYRWSVAQNAAHARSGGRNIWIGSSTTIAARFGFRARVAGTLGLHHRSRGRLTLDTAPAIGIAREEAFDYDPFSPAAMRDPYRFYPTLREQHPAFYMPRYDAWAISRYADVWDGFLDSEHFSEAEAQIFSRGSSCSSINDGVAPTPETELDPVDLQPSRSAAPHALPPGAGIPVPQGQRQPDGRSDRPR